jgi:hypothetical protein
MNVPIESILAIITSLISIIAGAAIGVKWLVKHYLSELKTNGGSSMRDEIKVIKQRQDDADKLRQEMNVKLDKMYDFLLNHVSDKNR